MARPLTIIETDDPFGQKLNAVMQAKGMAGDYRQLAQAFDVTVGSAREWIKFGRFAKERYGALVRWSGRSLHWWFDIDEPVDRAAATALAQERQPEYQVNPQAGAAWPFVTIQPADFRLLDEPDRREIEGLARGLIVAAQRKNRAA